MPTDALSAFAAEAPGFYGKLPARGDFVARRLGRPFIDAWDGWLQQSIIASRAALGALWLDCYLTSPIWRFALGAGACGPNQVLGIVMPSVDAVGRYFPLMLGLERPAESDCRGAAGDACAWYQAIEDLALAALEDGFQLGRFDEALPSPRLDAADAGAVADGAADEALAAPGRHVLLAGSASADQLCRRWLGGSAGRRTVWWTSGSDRVAPSFLACPGLPASEGFASLLDGDWLGRGWLLEVEAAAEIDGAAREERDE